jgi:hypothetical protein
MKNLLKLIGSLVLLLFINSCRSDLVSDKEDVNTATVNKKAYLGPLYTTEYNYLGAGYNVAQDFANENSAYSQVIDMANFKATYPNGIEKSSVLTQDAWYEYAENARVFNNKVTNKVTIGTEPLINNLPLFKNLLSSSFNSSTTTDNKFDAKFIYGSYNLLIKQKRIRFDTQSPAILTNFLTANFQQALQNLTPQQLVQNFGTHVLLDIYTGAKLEVKYQSETVNQDRTLASVVGLKTGIKDIFNITLDNTTDTFSSNKNFNRSLSYHTRGGDPSLSLIGTLNLDQTAPSINISNWQNSSNESNAVLVDIGNTGLIIIYDLILDPVKKAQVKAYVDQYLIDNQVYLKYVPVPVYSYYSSNNTDHYYDVSPSGFAGYINEGVAFNALNYDAFGTIPIYKYYSSMNKDHFYSRSIVTPANYVAEGIAFYANSTQVAGTVPIYRYWSSQYRDHYYTKSPVTPQKYVSEGIEFYAY